MIVAVSRALGRLLAGVGRLAATLWRALHGRRRWIRHRWSGDRQESRSARVDEGCDANEASIQVISNFARVVDDVGHLDGFLKIIVGRLQH